MTTTLLPQVPALVVGTVTHVRQTPVQNRFEHAHYQWMVDLDALPRLPWPIRLLSRFDARDHLDRGRLGGGIKGDLTRWLAGRGVTLAGEDRVLMLAHARSFGHVFNPLTVYWCVTSDGSPVATVLEVHNTYGERHAYLVATDDGGRAQVDKSFYVSPFNDTSGKYDVALRLGRERVGVSVALLRDDVRVLTAVTTGRLVPATTSALLRTVRSHLFMTQRVSMLIRWHGVRLWLRRMPIVPRPTHSQEAVR